MEHFRILLEIDNGSTCRKVYVKRENIIDAMDVGKKIKSSRILSIIPISYDQYMEGVSLKYSDNKA
jgi:hypothetical protein